MNNLYDALESCLHDIENGADVEAVLLRYSDIADELRPIVQASVNAKRLVAPRPSVDVMQRNRARLLQRASEMRSANVKPLPRYGWPVQLRRVAVTLIVLAALFASGTGLVRAASTTLPGDNLYPVKRTWEDVSLLFTLDLQQRESLAVEHENERLEECYELIEEGRSARVDFAGIVTQQNGDEWLVSGITIVIAPQTDFHDGPVFVGDPVRVFGILQSNDSVLVERIDQLPSGAQLPDIGNSGEGSNSGSGGDVNGNDVTNEDDSSGPGNGNDNSNDSNSGPGDGNDNSNDNDSGPVSGNDNENSNNSGSGSGIISGNDNSNDDNSGSGSSDDNTNEDSSGSGSGSDNSNDDNSGSGGGGSDDNGNEDSSGSGGGD